MALCFGAADPAAAPQAPVKPVAAQFPDVVARVNGETINRADLEEAVTEIEARAGQEPFLDLGQAEIGHADEARLPLPDEVVECAHRLVQRRTRIGPMHEIDVDMVGAQSLQALVDRG